jgi:hypothetical protein
MKAAIVLAAAAFAGIGIAATPAAAFHLAPSGDFTADGTTSATVNGGALTLPCIAHFTGTVDDTGLGHVTGATFEDNGGPPTACGQIVLSGLPWKTIAKTATKVKILNAGFTGPLGISCGPSTIPVILKRGVIHFSAVPMAGGCTVSGHLKTSPKVRIVP